MRTFLIALMMTLATQAGAEKILMDCGGTLYRYSKTFFTKPKIEFRNEATWQHFCKLESTITDRGGICDYETEQHINFDIMVDQTYLNKAQNILTERLTTCRKWQSRMNGEKGIQKAPWAARLVKDCSVEAKEFLDGWDFNLNKPVNEIDKFWMLNAEVYYSKHLPKIGRHKGGSKVTFYKRQYLDFVTFEVSYANRDGTGSQLRGCSKK